MSTLTAHADAPPWPTDERDIWRVSVERYEPQVTTFRPGDDVPVMIAGTVVGTVPTADLVP